MSRNSGKQRYEAFTEWHRWAVNKYPSFKKKKKQQTPEPFFFNKEEFL
jgi:hypothetical protein